MANSTIPNLVAVSVPALTDLLGVRQSGDSRDKKLTVTQLLSLAPGGGDVTKVGTPVDNQIGVWTGDGTIEGDANFIWTGSQLILPSGSSAGNPALSFGAAANRAGIFSSSASQMRFANSGVERFTMSTNNWQGFLAGSARMVNRVASATVPTFVPNTNDDNTGIGGPGGDVLSLIAGGVEIARATEAAGANQFAVVASGASTVPDLTAIADPDTGFRWTGSNEIITIHANVRSWHFISGSFFADNSDGPIIFNTTGSATVPSICVERSDPNTGLGAASSDTLSLIQGGVEGLRLRERNLGVIQAPQADLTITAFATGGQGSAVQLDSGSNVLGTVATTGDSVKLPPVFDINSVVFIKNDGANSADVFPATGDNLGAGVDTAVSLASGASISFIATIASSTWTQWIISVAPGGGIAAVVDDPSPQLGGDLDTNGSNIVNADTTLTSVSITAGTDPASAGGDLDLSSGDSGVGATGNAGDLNILAGSSVATTGDGGALTLKSGAGFFQGAGGDFLLEVGEGGAAGPGTSGNFFINTLTGANAAAGLQVPLPGLVSIYGIGRSGSGPAGNLELWGGYASGGGAGSNGGDAIMWGGGQGGGAGEGGNAMLIGGESDTIPGDAEIRGGQATSGGPGGQAVVQGGTGFNDDDGGLARVDGGLGAGLGNGGLARLRGGQSGSGATGFGGAVDIVGGLAASTNGDGGDINIISGTPSGSGADGDITLSIAGVGQFIIDAAQGIHAVNAAGPAMLNEAPTFANPTLVPNRVDLDTGLGWDANDQLSLVVGGVSGILLRELNSGVIQAPDAEVGLTAFATGGQANATQLNQSNNVLTTVATTADSVKLPPIFETNSVVFIKNDGVNAADVFPATGDDLGAGTNTAVSLAAGESASFIATAASTTWTPWIVSVGGGGGDVTKVGTPVDNQVGVWTGDGTIEGTTTLVLESAALTCLTRYRGANGAAGAPGFSFGADTNTGMFRQSAGIVGISCGGAGNWLFRSTSFDANQVGSPRMMFEVTSATNPVFIPSLLDTDTGLGSGAADQLDLIAGGLSCLSVRETGGARQVGFYVTAPISLQTGVAVSSAGIHAALVALGLITA